MKYIAIIKILIKPIQHCMMLPRDVEEGHFAVVAAKCEKPKRFVVELRCLSNPSFLRLLKEAGDEYGFKHEGAIAVPCNPHELQTILQETEDM
ncbi:SAUR-like auxin-responsive protein family [Artemisia annua]|uniref:SAUR-like auxin-responsive protein family n=1 Tax=Artemisia annua TaxID=35608 RepID=A0A2U1NT85_ARTAN|nr:SAUR-like auxin-responsive protein family [Artemisia annua]